MSSHQLQLKPFVPLTKILPPKVHTKLLSRKALREKLSESLTKRLTLISAPPGYGKTTLVSTWVQSVQIPTAWVSLAESENDSAKFWFTLLTALGSINSNLLQNVAEIFHIHFRESETREALINWLVTHLSKIATELLIVLDDYHLIEDDSIHSSMDYFLKQAPSIVHIVLVSRQDPPFPISRFRAHGQLLEIRAEDLCFTRAEIEQFYHSVLNFKLSDTQLEIIRENTEGWIAGMQLVALAIRSCHNPGEFIDKFTGNHAFIAEYLCDEVLNRQPAEIQDFLLKTSVLERMTPSLCKALTNVDNVSGLFQKLMRSNSFLIALDNEQLWFRYHHLFADVLQGRLAQRHIEQVNELHRVASAWFESHGYMAEAVEHALKAEDFNKAAALIELQSRPLLKSGETQTLHRWLQKLPKSVFMGFPMLYLTYGWVFVLQQELELAIQNVLEAEKFLNQDEYSGEQSDELWVEVHVLRGYIAILRKDTNLAIDCIETSVRRSPKYSVYFQAGVNLNTGEPCLLRSKLGLRGRLSQVFLLYTRLRQIWKNSGLAVLGYGSVVLGELYYEWNDFDNLAYFIPRGIELGKSFRHAGVIVPIYLLHAKYLRAQQAKDEMWRVIADVEKLARQLEGSSHWSTVIEMFKVRLWIEENDASKVEEWLRAYSGYFNAEISTFTEFGYLILARVLLFQNKTTEAIKLLERIWRFAEGGDRLGTMIEVCILRAITYMAEESWKESLASAKQAVLLAKPEGYRRTFFDEGKVVAKLLQRLKTDLFSNEVDSDVIRYVDELLLELNRSRSVTERRSTQVKPSLIEPLTKREHEILRFIEKGLTNAEIAATLCISVGTVKGYIHHLFGKLNVKNRTQAVAKARELNLFNNDGI